MTGPYDIMSPNMDFHHNIDAYSVQAIVSFTPICSYMRFLIFQNGLCPSLNICMDKVRDGSITLTGGGGLVISWRAQRLSTKILGWGHRFYTIILRG